MCALVTGVQTWALPILDANLLGLQSVELGNRLIELEREAYDIAGEEFNLGSPKQLCAILYDKLGCPVLSKTAGGQTSTAESVLAERSEDRSEGQECVCTCRSRRSPYH